MSVSVSKAKALVELVRAFEENDEKKAKKIGAIISHSIKKDSLKQEYTEYIELDKKSKRLFPQNVRSSTKKVLVKKNDRPSVTVRTDKGSYLIEITTNAIKIVEKEK